MNKCPHTANAEIKPPGLHGRAVPDVCPFVWCRDCGALWLPKQPSFDRAFEHHVKERAAAPFDGVTVEGYWILPSPSSLILD